MSESLDESDRRSRLTYDYQTAMMMRPLMEAEAYRNLDDLLARRNRIDSVADAYLATHYRVLYRVRTLIGPARYLDETTVRFDLFANNDYPMNEPASWVIDGPMPWSPHFLEGREICIGPIWKRAQGRILLCELMIHVARLLNFDEPPYEDPEYGGWQPDAVEYWETTLGRQPISKLVYPSVPRRVPQPAEPEPEQPARAIVFRNTIESSPPSIRIRPQAPAESASSLIKLRPQ